MMEANPLPMRFDTFLSFRGKEIRKNFIAHLYEKLRQLRIRAFKDDRNLSSGDKLKETLARAIEESMSSIVVLSKDYASSKWCLRELAIIMDCMDERSHQVFPVFYHVEPSHVRHQSGSFEKSFDKHEKIIQELANKDKEEHLKEEVQRWRDALTKIGNLVGEVVTEDSDEVDSINKITNKICEMLPRPKLLTSCRLNNLVDMELRLGRMKDMVRGLESNGVCFVVIVGMVGIGKTTIAEVFYDSIAHKFENNSCFLRIYGRDLVSVQRQLLSQLLRKDDIIIWDENEGARMIENHLSGRKVLIVLDGIDEKKQLEKLAGSFDWFGPRSQIIITTRNRDVIRQPNYNGNILEYNVELLKQESAFSLFCKHAFGDDHPDKNFIHLSEEIVEKVQGHPLALEQIGSSLYGQGIDIWREKLKNLTEVDNNRLFNILKVSFDKLEAKSQQAFLDIACFFNGKRKHKVVEILRNLGNYSPYSEIQLLCDRCFIEIKCNDTIFLPNFIQAMGQQIEREAPKRSRIWLRNDVSSVFAERGVKQIKGIVLDMKEQQHELVLEASLFKDMECLTVLEIGNVKLRGNFKHLSNRLGSLNWHGYPSNCLPMNFQSQYLFELLLPFSQTSQLWKGSKKFEKLMVIDASDSKNLVETPNFTRVPNLERLVLRNCTRLRMIDHSISSLNHLVLLDVTRCVSLKTFSSIISCKSLTTLEVSGSGLDQGLERLEGAERTQRRSLLPLVRQRFRQII